MNTINNFQSYSADKKKVQTFASSLAFVSAVVNPQGNLKKNGKRTTKGLAFNWIILLFFYVKFTWLDFSFFNLLFMFAWLVEIFSVVSQTKTCNISRRLHVSWRMRMRSLCPLHPPPRLIQPCLLMVKLVQKASILMATWDLSSLGITNIISRFNIDASCARCTDSPVNPSIATLKNISAHVTLHPTLRLTVDGGSRGCAKKAGDRILLGPTNDCTNRWPWQNSIWTPTKSHQWFDNHSSSSHYLYGHINYWHTIFHLWGDSCVNRRPHRWDLLHR